MVRYIYAPEANTLDGIMRPINPLMGANQDAGMGQEGWQPMYQSWALGGVSETGGEGWGGLYQSWALSANPLIRSDVATPTYDMTPYPTTMPRLDAMPPGLGAVADALSVLSVVDLLTRG